MTARAIEAGDTVRLTAKKKGGHGKNLLLIFGHSFVVDRVKDSVVFDARPGPWLLVTCDVGSGHCRWVHLTDDRVFNINPEKN